jgi:hypothetical protein
MQKKLTLTIDEKVLTFAKMTARRNRKSISAMVENYFKGIRMQTETANIAPITASLVGACEKVNLPDKKEMREYFHHESNR